MTDLLAALKRAEELQERATKGPWWRTDPPSGDGTAVHAGPSDDPHTADAWICMEPLTERTGDVHANLAYIAEARNLPLAAIRERIEGLERENATLRAAVDSLTHGKPLKDFLANGEPR